MYDLIIRGGMIVDGTRAPAYQADVCIQNGRIAEITAQCGAEAKEVIDAAGKVVSPGFIAVTLSPTTQSPVPHRQMPTSQRL